MLLHNLVPSSVETALPYASNHGKDWVPLWKGCLEDCEYFADGSNLLVNDSNEVHESNGKPKRRKLRESSASLSPAKQETKATTGTIRNFSITGNTAYAKEAGVRGAISKVDQCKEEAGKKILDVNKENILSSLMVERGASSLTNRIGFSSSGVQSNSELAVLGENLSTRDLFLSNLKDHGTTVGDRPMIIRASNKILEYKDNNNFDYCELCGELDNTLNMLLCDHCEEAFHVSCCNSKMKMFSADEWFCESCSQLDDKVSLEDSFKNSKNISWLNGNFKFKSNPIELMMNYSEAYVSRVRIGEAFQATVPEWSMEVQNRESDCIGRPLELDLAASIGLHGSPFDKFSIHNSASNWLQCQDVLYDDKGEPIQGTICGKWRRAPISEIQTSDWDCSCSVLWDPFHADCAVPQELETYKVFRQLKYIEQLRSSHGLNRKKN